MSLRLSAGLLVVILVASCGSSSTSTGSPTSTGSSASPSASASPAAPAPAWTMYHRDLAHTGNDPDEPAFTALAPAWVSPGLDGAVYAEPLVVGERVFTATENNTVYALYAASGAIAWTRHLASAVPHSKFPGCGDIAPLGVTSTPVIDLSAKTIFVVAFEDPGGAAPGRYHLVGLDITSGSIRLDRDITPAAMDTTAHQQRAALALSGGVVYVAWGGLFGDCGDYHGWLVGSRADGSGPAIQYEHRVPSTRESGLWAPSGPAADGAGNLYMTTGNAASSTSCDTGNTVFRWSPSLQVEDSFAAPDCVALNNADADLGSTGPVLVDGGRLFQVGKQQVGYLLNAGALQNSPASVNVGCGAYGGEAFASGLVFVSCGVSGGARAVRVTGTPAVAWSSVEGTFGAPIVAGGVVWYVDFGSGRLVGLSPATGAPVASAPTGAVQHFVTPTAVGGRIFVPTATGVVAFTGV